MVPPGIFDSLDDSGFYGAELCNGMVGDCDVDDALL